MSGGIGEGRARAGEGEEQAQDFYPDFGGGAEGQGGRFSAGQDGIAGGRFSPAVRGGVGRKVNGIPRGAEVGRPAAVGRKRLWEKNEEESWVCTRISSTIEPAQDARAKVGAF